MNLAISAHLSGEDKKKFEELWRHQTMIRERLYEIVNGKLKAAEAAKLKTENYESPSWALFQADKIGYARALTEVLQLFDIKEIA